MHSNESVQSTVYVLKTLRDQKTTFTSLLLRCVISNKVTSECVVMSVFVSVSERQRATVKPDGNRTSVLSALPSPVLVPLHQALHSPLDSREKITRNKKLINLIIKQK